MEFIVQTIKPIVEFYQFDNRNSKFAGYKYKTFSPTSTELSGKGLQSYSFSRNVGNFAGSFQLSIKEETNNIIHSETLFSDYVRPLDIVKIIENENDDSIFYGVVKSKKITANANGQKILTITGLSIEYLFEFLTISLDVTAMAWAGKYSNINELDNDNKLNLNDGIEPLENKRIISSIYNNFIGVAQKLSSISNVTVIELINSYFGTDFLENNNFLEEKFKYPISSNLYTNSTINIINYIRNLYPENVYELYGIMENGIPKIRLRMNPFSSNDWINLIKTKIYPDSLINYELSQSIDEVYTVFYSYIEGSVLAADYYNKMTATTDGYATSVSNDEKLKLYGYKPLQCNFIGFNTEVANELASSMNEIYKELNTKISTWYGKLDEMYNGSVTIVNIKNAKKPKIGERLEFIGGEFYVTGESHNWQYGSAAKITYTIERGGKYTNGVFSELKNISNSLVELKNAGN